MCLIKSMNDLNGKLDKIVLHGVMPEVFRDNIAIMHGSDVWKTETTFERGKSYLIMAGSGTGKSSLCSFLYGNRHDYSGKISFNGENIRDFDINRWCSLRTKSLALLPQEMRLFPELTVFENILIKNNLTGFRSESQIREMLERLDIAEKIDVPAGKLSIGQQQRVAVIRTLCQPADFLLLDEPVSHLDQRNNAAVAQLISEEAQTQGAGIIATSVGYDISLKFNLRLAL
ncbi:MAG: ATP-binding cassette domain-containing protein [Muribaculum sp.]|nr:ATP-binding cassette domain-containing protein [Muribaculum sp.]